jgi:hypothetical protein
MRKVGEKFKLQNPKFKETSTFNPQMKLADFATLRLGF